MAGNEGGPDPSSTLALLAGMNAGQSTAGQTICGFVPKLDGVFTGLDLAMNGPGRVIGAQVVPGALAMSLLPKMPPGNCAKLFQQIASILNQNPTIMDQAADIQTMMIDSNISFGGDFASSMGNVAPIGPGGGGNSNLEIG